MLTRFSASISYGSGKLTEPNTGRYFAVKLSRALSNKSCRIHTKHDVHILPSSETLIPSMLGGRPQQLLGVDCIFEPSPTLPGETNLAASRALVIPGSGIPVSISVINTHDQDYILKRGTYLGEISRISACDVTTLYDDNTAFQSSSSTRLPEPLQILLNQCDKHITRQEKSELAKLLSSYIDRFKLPNTRLGRTDIIKHDIDTGMHHPIKIPPRREPPHKHDIKKKWSFSYKKI